MALQAALLCLRGILGRETSWSFSLESRTRKKLIRLYNCCDLENERSLRGRNPVDRSRARRNHNLRGATHLRISSRSNRCLRQRAVEGERDREEGEQRVQREEGEGRPVQTRIEEDLKARGMERGGEKRRRTVHCHRSQLLC